MTRICIASSGLGHVARGIETWAADLGHALADRGEDVLLCKGGGTANAHYERVIPCWTRGAAKTNRLLKWLPRRISWRFMVGSSYAIEQTTFARNLLKVLKSEAIDIMHVQDPFVALLIQRARELGVIRTRTILAHGTEESLAFQNKFTYLQHLAPWHLQEARARGVHKETWTAIPNFVDTDRFRPGCGAALRRELGIADDGIIVLAAAAIKRRHKRIDYLIHEFRTLLDRQPDLQAWLVIAGGREAETENLITEAKYLLGDRVRMLVRFPRERMADLYRAADLFTLTSLKEMMPIALLEAISSGLPCIVNADPVMRWMIGPGGLSADLACDGSWAAQAAPLLSDRQRREETGHRARLHCLENFGRAKVVDQILNYYQFVSHHDSASKTKPVSSSEAAA